MEGRIRERRTQLLQFTGLDWESPRWSSINTLIQQISQTWRCSFLNQGWRGRGHLILCGNMIQLQMNLMKFSFSDAFSNTDPNIDIWVCLCKKWGIMCINKLLICWQLLQKRKSEHPNCPFWGGFFQKWFDKLILPQQLGAECSNAAYSGNCGKGGDHWLSKSTFFSPKVLKSTRKFFLNIRYWGAGSRLWQKYR